MLNPFPTDILGGMVKLGIGAAVAAVAAALLVALYAGASSRGREIHCRNNLRHLGTLAASNAGSIDPSHTGRMFWQEVRVAQYRKIDGLWKEIKPDPFVCPAHGRTESNPENVQAIDYRGPKKMPEEIRTYGKDAPLGADRPGNHPSGGWVLRLDTSVDALPPVVDRARDGDPLWKAAADALTD